MKSPFKLLVVLALMLAVFSQHTAASAGDISKFSGRSAQAFFFTQQDECVGTFVGLFANEGKFQNPPGSPGQGRFADAFIDRFNFCTGESVFFAFGSKALDASEFSIDRGLNSASLTTSMEMFAFTPGGEFTFIADIDMNWTGIGQLVRESFSFKSQTPKCKFMTSSRGSFRSAEASGVISDGSENFTPGSTQDAFLTQTRSGTWVVGCN
ncbi:MAG TPA: hypothetical protein VI451_00720 [Anaerolineales bacterium]|nr:hypothetical protein [Anaerolineales bacterium]